jgi:TetR/AcrR family transcriptional regulator, transcriptional repressor for nem operon
MARPRAFDESDVIDRAIRQFWSHGYEATSVDDLCAATGLNRSSLYRTFGSKRELLNTALSAYERDALRRIEHLLAAHPIREGLRRFLMGVFQDESAPIRQWGCLIGNCAGELAAHDQQAQKRLWRSMQHIEGLLCRALKRARQDGALSPDADAESLARFLMTQAQGLRLVAKTRPPRAVLENIVTTTLSILR